VHDVSWGTKGDNKVQNTDLGVVQAGKNKNEVEVAVPTAETDINAAYEDAIHVLSTKPPKVDSQPDAATQQEDYYRSFRTK
jgi:chitin synthase